MSEAIVSVEDAAFRLAELVEEVSTTGEPAVLTKAGRAVARLMPIVPSGEPSRELIDFLRRWRAEYPEPDDQLAEVIAESRRGVRPARDPWE
jgi:prevent-host-death family protein